MLRLSVEQIIKLHSELIKETGGSDGIRDIGLLQSAVNAPFQSFGGCDVYPTIYQKAARLGFGLAQNHAFIECEEFELFYLFFNLASSKITFEELTDWIENHAL